MQNQIRILQITDCIKYGSGVAAVILNYYKNINESKVVFDFMVNEPIVDKDIIKLIEEKGSRVYVMPSLSIKNILKYKKELEKFFREHASEYPIIHGHTPNAAAYYIPIAKKYGVPIRILHSHNSRGADSTVKRIRNRVMSRKAIKNATDRFACSKLAAKYLYGDNNVFVLNNAINLNEFEFDSLKRKQIREELGVSDDIILIGHIGRMAEQKNHRFIIEIAKELLKVNDKQENQQGKRQNAYKFLIIGDGPLRQKIEAQIKENHLDDMFILTGIVPNPKDYYQSMDLFILPSLYEGLPVVGVEAQAAGLSTLVSDKVTKETLMTDNIFMMPINDERTWVDWIISQSGDRMNNRESLSKCGFDIVKESKVLIKKYEELIENIYN